jgi:hypothetical protein
MYLSPAWRQALRRAAQLLVGALLGSAACLADGPPPSLPRLAPPELVRDGDQPIVVAAGHAAPQLVDLDGDGLRDLLVGQMEDGRLRIYRNRGSATAPRFAGFEWLEAEGERMSVPAG